MKASSSRRIARDAMSLSKGTTSVTYVIVEPCIGTKNASCVDVCPVSCIYEADDMYYINPDECIECGACEPECPVNAIFHESAVPAEWQSYTQRNRELSGL
jgi:ferredoxin